MKRARFQADMTLDDDSDFLRRRPPPPAPSWQHSSRPAPPPPPPLQRTPGFFGLPTEIKQHIYALVLDSDRADRPRAPFRGEHESSTAEIRYPKRYTSWRWPLAYWAHRNFRNELIDVAQERLAKRLVKAELDIMVNGFVLFPTWLHLPPDLPGDAPFDLTVSLRVFSGEAFRSNDGWPRQPGSGFRNLLRLLNQLVHEGPSFGQRRELLQGKNLWAINTLRVNVSFHDAYTPATHPETSHSIFRMLKALATSGLAHGIVKTIHAHSEFIEAPKPQKVVWDRVYPVTPRVNDAQAQQWRQTGFLTKHQQSLADDYRAPWDSSSGGPRQRGPKLVTPLERRDSPFGVVVPASKTSFPHIDDYGLITPPTPRASAAVEKRRSTPVPPSGGGGFEESSYALTPNFTSMLDDYSLVMTPVPGGNTDEDGEY